MRARVIRSKWGALAAGLGVVACCVAAPLLIGAACVALGLAGELAVAAVAVAVGVVLVMRRREA
jgi:hypothetical protein